MCFSLPVEALYELIFRLAIVQSLLNPRSRPRSLLQAGDLLGVKRWTSDLEGSGHHVDSGVGTGTGISVRIS